MNSLKQKLMTLTGFGLLALSSNALAYKQNNVAEFSFLVQSNDISLEYPNSVNRTKVSTLRATWWQPLTKALQGALSLAYVDMSQNSYGSVPAYSSTGYDLGIGLRGTIVKNNILDFGLSFTFDYLSTSGGTVTGKRTEVSWLQYIGSADFEFLPTKPVSILAGVTYTIIDGEQKIYNTLSSIQSFSANTPEGYYGGLGIKTGGTGRIEMKWYEGTRQGFYLTFSNEF